MLSALALPQLPRKEKEVGAPTDPTHRPPHGGAQPFGSKNSSAESSPDQRFFPVKTGI
jgi:hypothetical protein